MSNTPTILSELETLLVASGYSTGCKALTTLAALKKLTSADVSDYTVTRALALRDLAVKLKNLLLTSKDSASYTDRAFVLSSVADNYLKLTHAFKVDAEVWSKAQTDLVPLFSLILDEKSLDFAVSEMETHLNSYVAALDLWVAR